MAQPLFVLALITFATLLGDYCIKVASSRPEGLWSHWFLIGAALYGLPAIGWLLLMRTHSLAMIGVLYSASTIVLLAAFGTLVFREPIGWRDILGLILAVSAVAVMSHD